MGQYTLIGIELPDDAGQYQAVGPEGGFGFAEPDPLARIHPYIRLFDGWIYITGDNPMVGTVDILTAVAGSSMIVYINGSTTRCILLESDDDAFVEHIDGSDHVDFSAGYYVEVVSGVIGTPQVFSGTAFPGATKLLADVADAKSRWNLP